MPFIYLCLPSLRFFRFSGVALTLPPFAAAATRIVVCARALSLLPLPRAAVGANDPRPATVSALTVTEGMDETPIGAKTPSTGAFTTLRAFDGIDATVIGARAPRSAHFSEVRLAADAADARPGTPSKCRLAFTGEAEGSNVIEVPAGQTRALDVVDSKGASLLSLSSAGGASGAHPEGASLRIDGDVIVARGNVQLKEGDFLSGYVPLSVPDYVFAPTYALLPVEELAPFGAFRCFALPTRVQLSHPSSHSCPLQPSFSRAVRKHRHLPNMTRFSEAKLAERGAVELKELAFALLEKVEEQALYIAQLHTRGRAAEARLDAIERALGLASSST